MNLSENYFVAAATM